ncbi:MAG: histidinol-phosphatase [Elusimicrobia bacterium RIFCSPLOWO2_01_FULL_59_12]|nr:MAG: histidinol-phosphatase [Elusimicrobia bacterium RIFCSPLOWO2_01_FULL_59_12]
MDKAEVSAVLEEIGTLLELKGENPFKSRAYHNASRIIAGLDQDLGALVQEKKLTTIKGIGEGLSENITILYTTGRLPYYEDLQKSMPPGLLDMIRIQGVGPKRAKILYDQLKIKDIPGLEKAAKEGRIAQLEGFGEKSQENILKGLRFLSKHAEQHRYDEAWAAAEAVLAEMKKAPNVKRLSICGSLRRRREIIRDIDVLASAKNAKPVMDHFVKMPGVERVLGEGDTKSSVLTKDGFQVDLRVVDDADYPFALHYFTGSKEHNIAVRHLANTKGLKLSEYGLFRHETQRIPCKDETELFKKLGMDYLPPEMREDRGEIDLALRHKVPKLIEPDDIRGAFHVHSTWSDGRAELEDMIAAAQGLGWEYVGISDHSKSAAYAHGLSEDRVRQQGKAIEAFRKKFKIHIFWGTECDILKDGSLDYSDSVLANYDFVIASVHSHFTLSEADMTRRITQALRNKYVTILGHLTGRLLLEREPYAVDPAEVLEVAAAEGVAVELNASPHRFDIDWRMLPMAKEKGVKVSINPDAHSVPGLNVVPFGVGIARKGWLTKEDVINALPLKQITFWLRKRR